MINVEICFPPLPCVDDGDGNVGSNERKNTVYHPVIFDVVSALLRALCGF
jgi:hypothetical protein